MPFLRAKLLKNKPPELKPEEDIIQPVATAPLPNIPDDIETIEEVQDQEEIKEIKNENESKNQELESELESAVQELPELEEQENKEVESQDEGQEEEKQEENSLPEEIPGISVQNFIKSAKIAETGAPIKFFEFKKILEENMEKLKFNKEYASRDLNVGFSGGEKKKNEILQMLMLNPKLAILDETDSGLDVDAIKIVSKGIEMFHNSENSVLIITHGTKLLEKLKVDYVHILVGGKIIKSGTAELAKEIEKNGYEAYK